ncbi:MAG: FAD-dependent oxidoreductase [Anaerolineales bacterium]|nr:FAD-dependent oxidoreductase [Anaerolineales bacterium]
MPKNQKSQGGNSPVGAVMVVGGGIAGMQASLDLAEQGFKVYMVEKQSAIGGHMAKLDKTFPTNDCAMCTISPKLVETGRHPNIEILTNSSVIDVIGQAGNFTVAVQTEPRYIDPDKCVSCGDCAEVCPVIVTDTFNEGLSPRRAAFKLYPQAVPNAFAIDKAGIAPCRDACPAGQRAQGYIALIREGRWEDALRVIKMDNPFPGICGRICNHRCETACNRGLVDEPVNIRALKRFVTDKIYSQPRIEIEKVEISHPDKPVAIIGAGPCGLTAAQDIIRAGYPVTIFEAMPVAGGMLRLGVPEFRLPVDIIEREVQDITDLGVDLKLNHRIDNLDNLFKQGYVSVLIAVGAHEGVRLPIPGANADGVLINTEFLRDVRLGKYKRDKSGRVKNPDGSILGPNVLVLGGGNVAIDVARSAIRLGCRVTMACLESRESMPAHPWEVKAALAEGIELLNDRTFESITSNEHGLANGVECMAVKSFSFNEAGRLNVEKLPGSNHVIPCDTVIFSVGQRAGLAFIPDDAGVGVTSQNTIAINPNTFAATRPGVFAAGDTISGTAFVIEAVASGHQSAESIIRYLQGIPLEPGPKPKLPVVKISQAEITERVARGEIQLQPRIPMPALSVDQRLDNFAEVEGGYDDESAQLEAARCLSCGICSECMSCTFACGADAINHHMAGGQQQLNVGAVILAPGYQAYHAERSEEYGFGRYPNVINALQFERLLSASGPTMGHVQRPSDGKDPKKIAFLQCIGSRDQNHDYCSAVCCMYATKEAVTAKEHQPNLEIHVFMMDMRAFSKGYWDYFERARERYGINYHRSRISMLYENPENHNIVLRYFTEAREIQEEQFDLVVLSVGMEISDSVKELGKRLGVELDEYGFCHTIQFNPLETSRPGIYAVGPFREPKDIPESVVEGSGAAAAAATKLGQARFSLTTRQEYPPERDVSSEPPKVGVFVCSCGSNIGGFLDVPEVTDYAGKLPYVTHAEYNLYTCSQDSIKHISEQVKEYGLNRVVVASCSPLTHQPLFRDSIRMAGLNPYLFEMANIRNQCSWVHSHDKSIATSKARDLIRAAVARAVMLEPQPTLDVPVQHAALIIGGGAAGMTAASSLAEQGFPVHLVEKSSKLGGNLLKITAGSSGKDPKLILQDLRKRISDNSLITVHTESKVISTTGFMGNFTSTIEHSDGLRSDIAHGVVILATGGQEYRGPEYGYGSDPRIVTQQEFESILDDPNGSILEVNSIAMIQCVGPAEHYCSRICCTVALKNALRLKKIRPGADVIIFFKDIRTYGFKERLYTEARESGVLFFQYDFDRKPEVCIENRHLTVKAWEHALGREVEINTDLLVLSMPVVPNPDVRELSARFKVPTDSHGFFLEAHVKLRPVDFASDGFFMAGMAHYPKLLDETMIQAQAAAARSARVLSQESLTAGGQVAVVDPEKCTGCLTCVRICPFGVPKMKVDLVGVGGIQGAAYIEPAVCQGCGSCSSECPARAIQLMHYTDVQMTAKVGALIRPETIEVRGDD